MRDNDNLILESLYLSILLNEMPLYHSGAKTIDIENLKFDLGAIGFHVGTADQASDRTHFLKKKQTSQFEIYSDSIDQKLETITLERDMSWEHADGLLLELLNEYVLSKEEAYNLLRGWKNEMDSDHFENIENLIEIVDNFSEKEKNNFVAHEEIYREFFLGKDTYKNKKKLNDIRLLLINNRIGAIRYKNEVEGDGDTYSFVILDKRMIAPKNAEIVVGIRVSEERAKNILDGTDNLLFPKENKWRGSKNYDKYVNKKLVLSVLSDIINYKTYIIAYFTIGNKTEDGYPITSIKKIKPIPENTNPNIIFHFIGDENY